MFAGSSQAMSDRVTQRLRIIFSGDSCVSDPLSRSVILFAVLWDRTLGIWMSLLSTKMSESWKPVSWPERCMSCRCCVFGSGHAIGKTYMFILVTQRHDDRANSPYFPFECMRWDFWSLPGGCATSTIISFILIPENLIRLCANALKLYISFNNHPYDKAR